VIENIASGNEIDLVISDKFGRDDFIESALMKEGKKIKLLQEVRGEAVTQVAAASIVARAAFVKQMAKLSGQYHVTLPKGAGAPVDQAASAIVRKAGIQLLEKLAKTHFKNYRKIAG